MPTEEIAQACGDRPDKHYLAYATFKLETVRAELEESGYAIVRGLIPGPLITTVRDFWLAAFAAAGEGRVTWAPYLGQANHRGFSADAFQYLFRACDFLWNTPTHQETRDICLRLNALRNLVLGNAPDRGVVFAPDRYGMFVTASYYPVEQGHMQPHADGVAVGETLIHCLAPMTFRGVDYQEGGMTIVDRHGERQELEKELSPGDAVFYDGALEHGVAPIHALPGSRVGRLQISPLPTIFTDLGTNPRALNTISMGAFVDAKLKCFKNDLRIKLGLKPGLR